MCGRFHRPADAGVSVRGHPQPASEGRLKIGQLIEAAREHTTSAVNSTLATIDPQIGKRIRDDVLHEQRASYGEEIVYALSRQFDGRATATRLFRHCRNNGRRSPEEG
jgi:hypothetical protein